MNPQFYKEEFVMWFWFCNKCGGKVWASHKCKCGNTLETNDKK